MNEVPCHTCRWSRDEMYLLLDSTSCLCSTDCITDGRVEDQRDNQTVQSLHRGSALCGSSNLPVG